MRIGCRGLHLTIINRPVWHISLCPSEAAIARFARTIVCMYWRYNPLALYAVSLRHLLVLKTAVAKQFAIESSLACMVDLLEEHAIERRRYVGLM